MLPVEGLARDRVELRRRGEQVAKGLADVLDRGGLGGADLGPERLGGEFATQRLGTPAKYR